MPITLPTVDRIGALLRARTKTSTGNEAGTFTSETRPTEDEVAQMIGIAANTVGARGIACPEAPTDVGETATDLVAYLAAMLIELSYFPEAVGTERSAFDQYKQLYDDGIQGYVDAVAAYCGGDAAVGEMGGGGSREARAAFEPTMPYGSMEW